MGESQTRNPVGAPKIHFTSPPGGNAERFRAFAQKLVAVPKSEIDAAREQEKRQQR